MSREWYEELGETTDQLAAEHRVDLELKPLGGPGIAAAEGIAEKAAAGVTVTRALLLGSGPATLHCPLENVAPRYTWTLANRPAWRRAFALLTELGIEDVTLNCLHPQAARFAPELIASALESGLSLHLDTTTRPTGTAGALRDLGPLAPDERVLVMSASLAVGRPQTLLETLGNLPEADVLVLTREATARDTVDRLETAPDGATRVHLHPEPSAKGATSAGGWVVSAAAVELIPDRGYASIREQLVPAAIDAGLSVCARDIGGAGTYSSLPRYLEEELDALHDRHRSDETSEPLIDPTAEVHPSASVSGLVVIGPGCRVGSEAVLEGPLSIGRNVTIGPGASISESSVWEGAVIGAGASLRRCLIGAAASVPPAARLEERLILAKAHVRTHRRVIAAAEGGLDAVVDAQLRSLRQKRITARRLSLVSRLFDIAGALAILAVFAIPMLIAAIAIKLDSPGPVFYAQRRSGLNGKHFSMIKLRTMVADAHSQQRALRHINEVDGPMFKIQDDPRITRVGAFLRKTCLDEVPQALNVLRGEMALVGPRPLAEREMTLAPAWRDIRLSVKPGMTGLWQVSGREQLAFADWIECDIEYVKRQSLPLDVWILWRTAVLVLINVLPSRSAERASSDQTQREDADPANACS